MTTVNRIDEETFYSRVDDASDDDDEVDDDNIEEVVIFKLLYS